MIQPQLVPRVYVVAGPNGAGKTTFATEFLPGIADCRQFLNADLIAAGLSPFAPETQNLRAGQLLLERIEELTTARENFGFETTLSGRGYVRLLMKMRQNGYRVSLFFLWLSSADLAVERVANRVRQGGHTIPEVDVRRRYVTGLRNLFHLYRHQRDDLWLYDACCVPPALIAREQDGVLAVECTDLFDQIERQAGD